MSEPRLRVNAPQVIHETIDGEVIIINLTTGNYYSVKGSGSDVWDVVAGSPGLTADDVVAAVGTRVDRPVAEIAREVESFLEDLRTEGLVVGDPAIGAGVATLAAIGPTGDGAERRPFAPPVLEKYSDMQDLVLLDPVHEVDPTGWPQQRPETSAA